jgi:hypothetical protein
MNIWATELPPELMAQQNLYAEEIRGLFMVIFIRSVTRRNIESTAQDRRNTYQQIYRQDKYSIYKKLQTVDCINRNMREICYEKNHR